MPEMGASVKQQSLLCQPSVVMSCDVNYGSDHHNKTGATTDYNNCTGSQRASSDSSRTLNLNNLNLFPCITADLYAFLFLFLILSLVSPPGMK